jgi:hypothetical protein
MKKLLPALLMGTVLCLGPVQCTRTTLSATGGSGNDVETRIQGKITDETGAPASNTRVLLVPFNYNPVIDPVLSDSFADTTDYNGNFCVTTPRPGAFNIQAVHLVSKTRALIWDVLVPENRETVYVPQTSLKKCGTVRILLPDSSGYGTGDVFIPGTTFFTGISKGRAIIDSVPAGAILAVRFIDTSDTTRHHVMAANISVSSGDTATVADTSLWKFSKDLYLNTSSTGAAVSGTVVNFPVLVRLTAGNFDFSRANADGSDLRFTKSNGAPVPYEIERWDASQGSAEIWVKVDTVYGNNSMQYMTMYWGNPAAASASYGATVFDTSIGFQGVWHLGEATGLPVKDATGNHFDGTPSDTAPGSTGGMLGAAKQFNGLSSFFEMKNTASGKLDFPRNGTYSLSAWVWVDTLNFQSHMILTKGWLQYFIHIGAMNSFEFNEYVDRTGYERTWTPAVEKEWHYVTGVRSGSSEYLFVDGVCVDSTPEMGLLSTDPRTTTGNLSIGRNPAAPWNFFKGKIDEARIMDKAPGADWIKLCYMNQKLNDALVKFQ